MDNRSKKSITIELISCNEYSFLSYNTAPGIPLPGEGLRSPCVGFLRYFFSVKKVAEAPVQGFAHPATEVVN